MLQTPVLFCDCPSVRGHHQSWIIIARIATHLDGKRRPDSTTYRQWLGAEILCAAEKGVPAAAELSEALTVFLTDSESPRHDCLEGVLNWSAFQHPLLCLMTEFQVLKQLLCLIRSQGQGHSSRYLSRLLEYLHGGPKYVAPCKQSFASPCSLANMSVLILIFHQLMPSQICLPFW